MGGGRGRLINTIARKQAIDLITEACNNNARKQKACEILALSLRTLERWEKDAGLFDRRQLVKRQPKNQLTQEHRAMVMATANNIE